MNAPKDTVYVAGPYSSAPQENTDRAVEIADKIRSLGFTPYIPHLCHYWDEDHPHEYQYWLMHCLRLLPKFDHLVRFEGDSPGAETERELFETLDKPVYEGFEDFRQNVIQDSNIYCVVGPSGIGKSTIVNMLCDRHKNLVLVNGFSSRSMRSDEEQGDPYIFTSESDMLEKKENGDFIEFVEYAGNYYGLTEREFISALERALVPICIVTKDGYRKMKEHFEPHVSVRSIGIAPGDRGESYEQFYYHAEERGREDTFIKECIDAKSCDKVFKNVYDESSSKRKMKNVADEVSYHLASDCMSDKDFILSMLDKNIVKEEDEFKIEYKKDPDLQSHRWFNLK